MPGNELYDDVVAKITIQVEKAITDLEITHIEDMIIADIKKAGNGVNASGEILFVIDDDIKITSRLNDNGRTLINLPQLSSGKHAINVIYQGDNNYQSIKKETEIELKNVGINTDDKESYEKYLFLSLITIGLSIIFKRRKIIN